MRELFARWGAFAEDGADAPTDLNTYFDSVSLSLNDGLIGVNFYVTSGQENNIKSVKFTVAGRTDEKKEQTHTVATIDEITAYTCYVAAPEMANTITISVTNTSDTTVQTYLQAYQSEKQKFTLEADDIIKAIGNYGYCVQKWLYESYKNAADSTKWTYDSTNKKYTVNGAEMTEMDSTMNANYTALTADGITAKSSKTSDTGLVADSIGLALNLDYETSAIIDFTLADSKTVETSNVTLTKGDADYLSSVTNSGQTYTVKSKGIHAGDLTSDFTLTAKNNSEVDISYTFSPMIYVKALLGKSGVTDAEKAGATALYYYSKYYTDYSAKEKAFTDANVTTAYYGTTNTAVTLIPQNGTVVLYFGSDSKLNFAFLDANGSTVTSGVFKGFTKNSSNETTYENGGLSVTIAANTASITISNTTINLTATTNDGSNYSAKRIYSIINRTAN